MQIGHGLLTYNYAMANNDQMKFTAWVTAKRGRSLAIAQALGVTPPVVSDWVTGKKQIPSQHCKAIQALSEGEVTCQDMRPDDWQMWWPELAVVTGQEVIDRDATRTGIVRRQDPRRDGDIQDDSGRRKNPPSPALDGAATQQVK